MKLKLKFIIFYFLSSVPRRCIHRLKSYQIRGSGKTLTNKKLFIKKQLTKKLQSSDRSFCWLKNFI